VGDAVVLVQAAVVLLLVVRLVRHGGWGLLVLQGLLVVVEGERKIWVDHNRRGVDVRGWRDGLVAVAVKIEVGISITGCIVAAAADTVTIVTRRDVLDAENYATWIVHKLAAITDARAEASQVTWVVAEMVTEVTVASAFTVIACCLACGVTVGVVETVGSGLHLWLRNRICIVDS
jgi:hypothetical protein